MNILPCFVLALFGVNIPSDNSGPSGLTILVLLFLGYILYDKIVNEKNVPVAIIVGAIMIVLAILSLR
jgi:hypothetical protein